MATFSDEHKEEFEQGNYFDEGVHKVKIGAVVFGSTEDGKEFAEFTVVGTGDQDEREGTARVWFTTDPAIKYSFNTIRSIFVHNAPEDKKDKARSAIDAIKDTEELEKACQHLIGKEAWYTVYQNPTRQYTGQDGKLRNSLDRNILGYEPKPRTVSAEQVEDLKTDDEKPKTPKAKSSDSGEDAPFGF